MADRRYRNYEFLHEKYVEQGLSTCDIADLCGTTHATVLRWLGKRGIETREPILASEVPSFDTNPVTGYERWRTRVDGDRKEIYVHRLAVVAWFGWDEVVGKEVHHVSNIPWDTRESNI